MEKTKLAICSTLEKALIFNTVGFKVVVNTDIDEIRKNIYELINDNYLLIFLDDELYIKLEDVRKQFAFEAFPVFTPLPLKEGKSIGLEQIYQNVEKAIGFNIFRKE